MLATEGLAEQYPLSGFEEGVVLRVLRDWEDSGDDISSLAEHLQERYETAVSEVNLQLAELIGWIEKLCLTALTRGLGSQCPKIVVHVDQKSAFDTLVGRLRQLERQYNEDGGECYGSGFHLDFGLGEENMPNFSGPKAKSWRKHEAALFERSRYQVRVEGERRHCRVHMVIGTNALADVGLPKFEYEFSGWGYVAELLGSTPPEPVGGHLGARRVPSTAPERGGEFHRRTRGLCGSGIGGESPVGRTGFAEIRVRIFGVGGGGSDSWIDAATGYRRRGRAEARASQPHSLA